MRKRNYRIYPFRIRHNKWDESCWWTVHVFPTRKEMHKALKKKCPRCKSAFDEEASDCLGLTHLHRFKQKVDVFGNVQDGTIRGEIGRIFLHESETGVGVVSHEMCHALFYTMEHYTSRIILHDSMWNQADEYMAGVMGNLMNSFYSQYLGDSPF